MTTHGHRKALHTILDFLIDIENQGIAEVSLSCYSSSLSCVSLKDANKVEAYYKFLYAPSDRDECVSLLENVAREGLSIIPGYQEKVNIALAAELEKYEALKAKFGEKV